MFIFLFEYQTVQLYKRIYYTVSQLFVNYVNMKTFYISIQHCVCIMTNYSILTFVTIFFNPAEFLKHIQLALVFNSHCLRQRSLFTGFCLKSKEVGTIINFAPNSFPFSMFSRKNDQSPLPHFVQVLATLEACLLFIMFNSGIAR